jgi:hypothetical protein
MTYRGKVKDGTIVLESGAEYPEGAAVRIPKVSDARRRRRSIFEVPLHDGGALLKSWTREELMDEMLDP